MQKCVEVRAFAGPAVVFVFGSADLDELQAVPDSDVSDRPAFGREDVSDRDNAASAGELARAALLGERMQHGETIGIAYPGHLGGQ